MLSICYVIKGFPLASETFVSDEAYSLQQAGVEVHILHLQPGQTDVVHQSAKALLEQDRARLLRHPSTLESLLSFAKLFMRRPLAIAKLLWSLRNSPERWMWAKAAPHAWWCVTRRVDYLHAHFADINLQYAFILSKLTGIPYGVTTHRYDLIDDPLPLDEAKSLMAQADVLVTISEFNRQLMASKFGLDTTRTRIIRCGVDLGHFPYRPPERKSATSPLRVVSVGRLVHVKGHDVLIRAVGILKRLGRQCHVRIVGAGPEHERLADLAKAEQVFDQVRFLGALRHDQVRAELESADLFVLSSRSEGIPVACMETMATGTPIIATRINGLPELIDSHVSGQLVEPDNPDQLATAIAWVMDNPAQVMEMSACGRAAVEREFTRNSSTSRWLDLLHEVQRRYRQ